jgi:hypothetical protein
MFSMGELVLIMASTDEHAPDAHAPDATTLNPRQKALLSHLPTHKQTIIIEIKTEYCIEYKKALDSFVSVVGARIVSCFANEKIQQPTMIPLLSQERLCGLKFCCLLLFFE